MFVSSDRSSYNDDVLGLVQATFLDFEHFWSWNDISAGWREAVSVFRGDAIQPSSLVSDDKNDDRD